ncbi:hypothetical protein GWK41_06210 [Persephonella atlantica]|uniref:Uncharacterized protein n=1 Tax=Persephonella atlantica TaxID=2699429 RepID=A0ABS1GI95_9AQUI|nr:hypothetical protein [Persephonella atlantica]MBK3332656.1 hypothetical protein [Persephonella atlantica]
MESDFDSFRENVVSRYRSYCKKIIKQAQEKKNLKIKQAEGKGKRLYERKIKVFRSEIKNLERKQLLKAEQMFQRSLNLKLKELEEDLKDSIRESLEQNFEQFVYCFSKWLKKRFSEGSVKTKKEYFSYFEDYSLTETDRNEVIFERKNVIITFSPEKVVEEKEEKIKSLIGRITAGL